MRPFSSRGVVAMCGVVAALLAGSAACNGQIQNTGCSGNAPPGASGFCEAEPVDAPARSTPSFPDTPVPPAPSCGTTERVSIQGSGGVCAPDPSPVEPGGFCADPEECASVCCVVDSSGSWAPVVDPLDAGADGNADSDADAIAAMDARPTPLEREPREPPGYFVAL
jgi:hypothetical protein